jgi:putative ABC transport system permease protein
LSARAQAGRYFLSREEGEGKPPVVVLSDALWRKKYAGNRDLIGHTILFNGHAMTVVGILPPHFKLMFPEGASVPPSVDIYMPFPSDLHGQARDQDYIRIIGRLRDGTTLQQGQAELDNIATQLRSEFPEYSQQNLRIQVFSLQTDVARAARPAILALTAGTSFVLLIACANIAMLLLSRASERRAEISVRAALGAQSGRLLRQLLTESLLLSLRGWHRRHGGLLGSATYAVVARAGRYRSR